MTSGYDTQSDIERARSAAVANLRQQFDFDFVSAAVVPTDAGAQFVRWKYVAGATSDRYRRIVLSSGSGIGGIVFKTGKPMIVYDIDEEIDASEFSSYPIVFAEDLRAFCAVPLMKKYRVHGVLLCAFRTTDTAHKQLFTDLLAYLEQGFCEFAVGTTEPIYFANRRPVDAALTDPKPRGVEGGPQRIVDLIIGAQEEERRRISRELHDGVAQELLSVLVTIRSIPLLDSKASVDSAIETAEHDLQAVFTELHNISVQLRPLALDDLGLQAAFSVHFAWLEKAYGVRIDFNPSLETSRFEAAIETAVYRICQEAVVNACKYAHVDFVSVTLTEHDDTLSVCVKDAGLGFDVEHPTIQGSGCGLAGMAERAHLIGADFEVDSNDGGTTVTLNVPLKGSIA